MGWSGLRVAAKPSGPLSGFYSRVDEVKGMADMASMISSLLSRRILRNWVMTAWGKR